MNIRRFRSENLAFEETPGIVTQGTRRSVPAYFPPGGVPYKSEGDARQEIENLTPQRETNVGVAQA